MLGTGLLCTRPAVKGFWCLGFRVLRFRVQGFTFAQEATLDQKEAEA